MLRKMTVVILAVLIVLSLAACGGNAATKPTQTSTEAPKTEQTQPTEAPTEAQTDQPTEITATYPMTEELTAEEEKAQKEAAAAVASDFFDDYLTTVYLYADTDIESHTTLRLEEAVREQIAIPADAFPLQISASHDNGVPVDVLPISIYDRVRHGETVLTDHAAYQLKKFAYWKEMRESEGIVHEQPERSSEVTSVELYGDYAQVKISGGVTFRYVGQSTDAYSAEGLEIFLYRCDGTWYVFDAFDLFEDTQGFDDAYRNTDFV